MTPKNLEDEALKLSMYLDRYSSSTQINMEKALKRALDLITLQLIKTEDLTQQRRLITLNKEIREILAKEYGLMYDYIQEDLEGVSDVAYTSMAIGLATHGSKIETSFSKLPKTAIQQMLNMNTLVQLGDKGYTLNDFVTNQESLDIKRFKEIVASGIAKGENPNVIARRLRKLSDTSIKNDFKTIARTVTNEAFARANAVASNNASDVVIGWESVSVLDGRTTFLCASLDGRIWLKSNGWTVQKLIERNLWENRHFNCRTRVVMITKFTKDFKKSNTRAENGDVAGQVQSTNNFKSFFDRQSETFKIDYLGASRYKLYKENNLKISSFVDIKTGQNYTIEEIKKRIA